MKLAICSMVRDERQSYIDEWVSWHRKQGVERFFIYNNGNTPFISGLDIEERPWLGKAQQLPVFDHCLSQCEGVEFLAFIDLDEFIIGPLLSMLDSSRNGIALNWKVFGSSGLTYNHIGKQLGVFVRHVAPTVYSSVKCVVRVSNAIKVLSPHAFLYKDGINIQSVNGDEVSQPTNPITEWPGIFINHYIVRSKFDWFSKVVRGRASVDKTYDHNTLDIIDALCTETDTRTYF